MCYKDFGYGFYCINFEKQAKRWALTKKGTSKLLFGNLLNLNIRRIKLYFVCYMIERVARKLHQRNRYVVNAIGKSELRHLISVANVLHCENPLQVEDDWINEYELKI